MVLAHPNEDLALSKRMIKRDYFLPAIGDPEMEIRVREGELPDLRFAYKTVI